MVKNKNKKNEDNSSNSLVVGRWLQTKMSFFAGPVLTLTSDSSKLPLVCNGYYHLEPFILLSKFYRHRLTEFHRFLVAPFQMKTDTLYHFISVILLLLLRFCRFYGFQFC